MSELKHEARVAVPADEVRAEDARSGPGLDGYFPERWKGSGLDPELEARFAFYNLRVMARYERKIDYLQGHRPRIDRETFERLDTTDLSEMTSEEFMSLVRFKEVCRAARMSLAGSGRVMSLGEAVDRGFVAADSDEAKQLQ